MTTFVGSGHCGRCECNVLTLSNGVDRTFLLLYLYAIAGAALGITLTVEMPAELVIGIVAIAIVLWVVPLVTGLRVAKRGYCSRCGTLIYAGGPRLSLHPPTPTRGELVRIQLSNGRPDEEVPVTMSDNMSQTRNNQLVCSGTGVGEVTFRIPDDWSQLRVHAPGAKGVVAQLSQPEPGDK